MNKLEKEDDKNNLKQDGYFPSPWNIFENEQKTLGWLEFQKCMRKDPDFYKFDS